MGKNYGKVHKTKELKRRMLNDSHAAP